MVRREHGVATLLIRPHCSTPQADADLVERATRENFAQHTTRFLLEHSLSGRRMHDPNLKRIIGSAKLHATGFAIGIEYDGVLLVAAPLAQLEKSAGLFVDLAHRNQTNASCDAQNRPAHNL